MSNIGLITANHLTKIQGELERNHNGFRKRLGTALKSSRGNTVYTPPLDPTEIEALMSTLERFINDSDLFPADPLIKMALIHHQFESIHPFYDGKWPHRAHPECVVSGQGRPARCAGALHRRRGGGHPASLRADPDPQGANSGPVPVERNPRHRRWVRGVHGVAFPDAERFKQWRTINGVALDPLGRFNELGILVRGALAPARRLDCLRDFVPFEDDGRAGE
ncbi:MAG: Fic family protein, partial [Rhodocyclaceae bacterium]